ncbi:imidazole glycerol phosphate synthase subunit HisH [Pseudaquabacterium pictum]|uniref:Imidazole glycerol phosphate synthase subunit HisH n=1 Tax=Pseudaquabacterium pictum TaxID=2315236 RepID=A0A480B215_9BURK|nr:imidazole glycerol phosphate synthase subunit HisH [Rubrivivax pictus]GCL65925.1 imidazole glycerol phosphate synthase subunit HisH [Rubrivivax pictus]
MRVGVVDYGVGNLGSVLRALASLGAEATALRQPAELAEVDRLVLPGVGSFTTCMGLLDDGGWTTALQRQVQDHGTPLLGICLGMQLLASSGLEGAHRPGGTPGLGLVPGRVVSLASLGCIQRLPHVGWNGVQPAQDDALLGGIPTGTDFYFVHSYGMVPDDSAHLLATTDYGLPVAAVVRHGPVCGTQFHPEKSGRAGFRLLRNFLALVTEPVPC